MVSQQVKNNSRAIANNASKNRSEDRKIKNLQAQLKNLRSKFTTKASSSIPAIQNAFYNTFMMLTNDPVYMMLTILFMFTAISYQASPTSNVYLTFLEKLFTKESATYKYLVAHAVSVIGHLLVVAIYSIAPMSSKLAYAIIASIFTFSFVPSSVLFYIIPFLFTSFFLTLRNKYARFTLLVFGLVFYFILYETLPRKYRF
jgi:hypothetical protein